MRNKQHLTTGEVARLVGVSIQTVIRCVDREDLKGHKVPGSNFRRVTKAAFVEWASRHGLPFEESSPLLATAICPAGA